MISKRTMGFLVQVVVIFALTSSSWAQSINSSMSGTVTDPSGAVVPGAELVLTAVSTGAVSKATSGPDGLYSFLSVPMGAYELRVAAKGFRDFVQKGIWVDAQERVRIDVKLDVGIATQTVEVTADASPLNFENAQVQQAITPSTIANLPLIVAGARRSAAAFVMLMPGVNSGASFNPFEARVNGGQRMSDEALLDGVTLMQGMMSQGGMVTMHGDSQLSPDAVSEISVITSNYDPQYGGTGAAVITAVTKSGTNDFHGNVHWFQRNTALNARPYGTANRPKDLEHEVGGNIGGPAKLPGLWSGRTKTYFFFNMEQFRVAGSTTSPILTIPTLKMRNGDFSEWALPIYDPATTLPNPAYDANQPVGPSNLPYLRDQFRGCDPVNNPQPNVICATDPRVQNSLAKAWFQFLPEPNRPGVLYNYEVPIPPPAGISMNPNNSYNLRIDHYFGDKDHFFGSFMRHYFVPLYVTKLPRQLADEVVNGGLAHNHYARISWDHTFRPDLLNNLTLGYLNQPSGRLNLSDIAVNDLPKIPGVFYHEKVPVVQFQGYQGYGANTDNYEARPTISVIDTMTWARGKHTVKFGAEHRALQLTRKLKDNGSGTFYFSDLNTGLLGMNSGNAMASFLLEAVSSASFGYYMQGSRYARGKTWIAHIGDTWKVTPKLSLNYGVRWDLWTPSVEKYDQLSFFDPVGSNPGAGNRLGRLAFAGTGWGPASFGRRHPEETWWKGFAPRLGIAYGLRPKTVVRAGYGIFYMRAYYPGWQGGMSSDGFNSNPSVGSSLGGLEPAFILHEGFPQNFTPPPFIDSTFLNGSVAPMYRPFDANRLPYTQQWNLTIEHQFTDKFYVSASYLGNKGTRLLSQTAPLNALDPKLLSMGQQLFDQFQPGQTELHGVPVPYAGWVEQMRACPPSVAQALLPYPQYCGNIYGVNENAGNSTYNSFQLKVENRLSHGVWFLGSYTVSKLLTSSGSDMTQGDPGFWTGLAGAISPFQRHTRGKALAADDVPQVLSLALVYQLPFGKGQSYLNQGGVLDKFVGGWELSSIFRITSGTPLYPRSSRCNRPGQFAAACIPAVLSGANPWAQDKGSFEPSKPLLNKAAFEPAESFDFYLGQGARVSNLRGFGYQNQDFSLIKNTRITERVNFQFRAEFFNLWNWHSFNCSSFCWGNQPFNVDVASPGFGYWVGYVTPPRNIQLGAKLIF